ncbi:hypothetical protein Ahy_B06g083446 [Arachis hypogaea]|uniref:MULE transposase domain-containing protein n=1 Tax=Arachis hypogaea TaxID=3818 RepID=A0A444YPS0_ARAHY|nr:hypothetical protein Ahy_B06g083446 [Arachis hypogaea]
MGLKVDEFTDVIVMEKNKLELRHEFLDHSGINEEKIPVIRIYFDSLLLAQKFYANYAKKFGFIIKAKNTNFYKMRKKSKIPINQSIHYTREGYRESQAKKSVHYHEYRELTMHAKCVITDNEAGIRPNMMYLSLANKFGGSSDLSFSEKDVRNYITSKLRCADENADFKKMMNYFVWMKEINPNFFYTIDVDDANKFRSTLWVDARCRASYEYYADVVSFYTTYRINRYGLPVASFVGVNHHGKSTLLGCALLGSEEIPSFE